MKYKHTNYIDFMTFISENADLIKGRRKEILHGSNLDEWQYANAVSGKIKNAEILRSVKAVIVQYLQRLKDRVDVLEI